MKILLNLDIIMRINLGKVVMIHILKVKLLTPVRLVRVKKKRKNQKK